MVLCLHSGRPVAPCRGHTAVAPLRSALTPRPWTLLNQGASDYDLTVKFEPISVELDPEPDDRFEEANDLVLSEDETGHATGGIGFFGSGKNDDDDWYRVTIDSDGFLSLMLEIDHDCGDGYGMVSASLYDTDGITELEHCETYSAGPNGQVRTWRDLRPGVYYLRVSTLIHSWNGANQGASGYILTPSFSPVAVAPDTEPNDRFEKATAVELDHQGTATVTGGIGFWGSGVNDDDDWYSIVIPTDTFVTIGLELESSQGDGNGTLSVSWYDTDGVRELVHAAATVAGPNGATQSTTDVRPGTHFLRVSSLIHSWNSANQGASGYTVRISADPISWEQDPEPNDRFEQASALPWSEPDGVQTTGGIGFFGSGSNDDDDWYRLELPRGGDLMATLELDTGQPDGYSFISVSIYGSDGTTEASHAETYQAGPNHLAVANAALPAGTAYLRVSTFLHSYYNADSGASGYALTAKFQ